MPKLVESFEFVAGRIKKNITTRYPLPTTNSPGFSYIEILLSLFLIIALIAILLTTSTTYIHSRRTNLQTIATKMASCEIERLRKLAFASLPANNGAFDASCTAD